MYCKKCGSSVSANAVRCPVCGAPTVSVQPNDYTAQYDPRDIADNRVFAALSYLGILILVLLIRPAGLLGRNVKEKV